jgi:hypothetical protein
MYGLTTCSNQRDWCISFTLNAMGVLQQGGYPPDHPTAVNVQKGLENLLSLDRS